MLLLQCIYKLVASFNFQSRKAIAWKRRSFMKKLHKTMSHLLSDIYFFKKSNWLFVLTLFGCQKWGFTMEVENWLLLLENPDNKASVWSCLQLYISCLAWPCPPSQVQCRPHKSHQQAVSQAGILPSKMLQCKNEHVTFECKTFNVWGAHLSQMRLKGAHLTQNLNVWGGTFESNSWF